MRTALILTQGGTVWGILEGVFLLKEIRHWREALSIDCPAPLPVYFLHVMATDLDVSSSLSVPAVIPAACCYAAGPRWTLRPLLP